MAQDIVVQPMGNFQLQDTLFWSVLMHVPFSQSTASSRKLGDTWMHIGMCTITLHMPHLDNKPPRKKLDAHQAAFANKQYKSHQRVGLPGDIFKSLATKGKQKAPQIVLESKGDEGQVQPEACSTHGAPKVCLS